MLRMAGIWVVIIMIIGIMIAAVVGMWTTIKFVSDLIAEPRGDDAVLYQDVKEDLTMAEGKVMHVYRDTRGFLTGGIGHKLTEEELKTIRYSDTLTESKVEEWFQADYQIVIHSLNKHFPQWDSYPHLVKLALINWMWQIGENAPSKFPRATALIKQRKFKEAAQEWLYADTRTHRWSKWRRETTHRCEQESERLIKGAEERDAQ